MNEMWRNVLPALIGGSFVLLTFLVRELVITRRRVERSGQLDYIRTIFSWPKISQFFAYLIWNIHFLSNIEHLFPDMRIREDNLKTLRDSLELKHIITEILAYIWVQSNDAIKIANGRDLEPQEYDKILVNSLLVVNRLSHEDVFTEFINYMNSKEDSELHLRDALNKFIYREQNRIFERTSYMNFLLSFACYPGVKEKLLELINAAHGANEKRWEKIENILEEFLSGKRIK